MHTPQQPKTPASPQATSRPQRYSLLIAYDGAAYAGWQVQPNQRTVQSELEAVLRRLAGAPVKLHGSGRTDQGVHATGQVAHCDLPFRLPAASLARALNALLPAAIRILRVQPVGAAFHARRSAARKEYRYCIWNGDVIPPFLRLYRTHVRMPLDVRAMRQAAALLVGRHDFAAFTANPNREVESTRRHVMKLTVSRKGPEIIIRAQSDGFLYKMVRSLAGFLIRVGAGAVPPEEALRILHSKIRTARVPTAPPQGLFLWRVWYV
ncbi:MAG: tRNA pseudouridine(38-40) synthase TruA [Verrucomicrobia bacterium]|nr:tRNA pseudouridine(38-40) synthase TruA [Verrucomicrobiota bacterium]MBU4285798.1 tRNA pseudouridine(38-40) synthase TruA [Verrucomicrobiota bacterium]MBU4366709.1 tRNA pseudouridine(38-40) synthase TruA [Verrucomicrobiota bacterium]